MRDAVVTPAPSEGASFQQFYGSMPVCAWLADPVDGVVVDCNESARALLGHPRDARLGAPPPPFSADPPFREWLPDAARAAREPRRLDVRLRGPDGEVRELRITAKAFDDGVRALVLVVAVDAVDTLARDALRASEERFRSVVENMSEGLMLFDPQGNLVFQNRASLRIHGFDPDADGRIGHDALPATWDAWDEAGREIRFEEWPVSRVFRGERFENQLLRVSRRETGHLFHGSYNGCPIRDADGALVLGFITIRDVTAQVEAREALASSERRFARAVRAAGVGTWDWDARTGRQANSPGFEALYDCEPGELDSRAAFLARVHPDDRPAVDAAIARALDGAHGDAYDLEYRVPTRDGGERWLRTQGAVTARDPAGAALGVAGVVTDVTDRRRAAEALRDVDRRKDEFLATLAHELRNPLAPLRNGLSLLARLRDPDPAATAPIRAMMDRQLGHLVRLVDDLLEMSRITTGKLKLVLQRVELAEVLDRAVEGARPALDARGHRLLVERAGRAAWLDADPVRLAQVFTNLLNNAAKYTDPGGTITIGIDLSGPGRVRACVRDTGIGLDAAELRRVFDLFVQLERDADKAQGGLGIGLSLARRLVEMHGGTLTAASEGHGRGATFTVCLPLVDTEREAAGAAPVPLSPAAARRILVADDNRDAADSLASMLRIGGHEVEVAYDGREALERLREQRPEVAILDIGMPVLDGHEVARRVRREHWGRETVLVALTGWSQDADRHRTAAAGFDHHLAKPAAFERLEALLAAIPHEVRPDGNSARG